MYIISLINGTEETIIDYPCADKNAPKCLKKELDEKAGEVTNLALQVPFGNPGYDKIYDLITLVKVTKIDTGEVIFEGRVFNSIKDLTSEGEVYIEVNAESELIYLNDSLVDIWDIENMSVYDFFAKVINNHNSQVGTLGDKQFTLGNIEVQGSITVKTNLENSLNSLISNGPNNFGGYLSIRKENNIRYLDYLPNLNGTSADIVITKNAKDIQFSKDVTNIATRLRPVGKDGLDITTVNNGVPYLDNLTAQQEYGILTQKIEFQDTTDAETLKQQCQDALPNSAKPTYKLTTNILDTSVIGLDAQGFYCGTDTNVICDILGFNESFTIIEKVTDLEAPQNAKLTINDKFGDDTTRQIALQRTANIINGMLTSDNNLNGLYLANVVDLLKCQMHAMADTAEKQQAKAILFEDRVPNSPTYGAMALGTQGFMIASEIVNDEWDWSTFGTGKGFVADLIIAGKILGGAVEFNLDEGYLKINHSDGSYTLINADGINRYNGTTKQGYHYLSYSTVVSIPANTGTTIGDTQTIVQLPDEFKGKNIQVSTGIKEAMANFVPSSFGVVESLGSGASVLSFDDATVTVTGNFSALDYLDSNHTIYSLNQHLQITLTAIA